MKICEYYCDDEQPQIDGDWIRNILVLSRTSQNSIDTDGSKAGSSPVKRKFNKICESEAEYKKLDGHISYIMHKFDGSHTTDDELGTFHNAVPSAKGLRMDLQCRKVAESYPPQVAALRDNIEHKRPFGGFSVMFDGEVNEATGEVETIVGVDSIDLVPKPSSVKSIVEGEADYDIGKDLAELRASHTELCSKHAELCSKHEAHIAECSMTRKVSESVATRTLPPPIKVIQDKSPVDPLKFVRGEV